MKSGSSGVADRNARRASRQPDMVGMKVCDDQTCQPPAAQWPAYQLFPEGPRLIVANAGVQDRPSIPVLDQIDIDVVESERERNAHPKNTGRYFLHLT